MRTIFLALLLALAMPAAAAQAAAIYVAEGVLRYKADRGERNGVSVEQTSGGDYIVRSGGLGNSRAPRLRFGAGCRPGDLPAANTCEGDGVKTIRITLGDLDDSFCTIGQVSVPVHYSGGDGRRDTGGWCFPNPGVVADNDGDTDDGPLQRDNFNSDVERLTGTENADTLGSGGRGGSLFPGDGDDRVLGGSGPDRIGVASVGTDDDNAGRFFPEGVDTVECGGGQDFVLGDRSDTFATDCEAIGWPTEDGDYDYDFGGSNGPDFVGVPDGWVPALVNTGPGADVIQAPAFGSSRIFSGAGNDRIREPGNGRHTIFAGLANDVIIMRDGRNAAPSNRDIVHCEAGFDHAFVDRFDRVSRDCERVSRR